MNYLRIFKPTKKDIGDFIFIFLMTFGCVALISFITDNDKDSPTITVTDIEYQTMLENKLTSFKELTSDELITINNKTIYIDKDSLSYDELYHCSQLAKIEYKVIIVR